jgi:ribosomal protein S19E (S16A)
MGTPPDLSLSPSEKRTLQKVAEGEFQVAELDWVALQRLKALGLMEERSTGVVISAEGRRVLRALITKS